MFLISVNKIRTIKEILVEYFQIKKRVIHVILNRENH